MLYYFQSFCQSSFAETSFGIDWLGHIFSCFASAKNDTQTNVKKYYLDVHATIKHKLYNSIIIIYPD